MPSSEKHCGVLRKANALTLIELLFVIGVIGILAAIIFPILATAKENGRRATCLSNLNELGEGMRLYAHEWNGHLPTSRLENGGYGNPSGNWAGVYQVFGKCDPRMGQIFRYVRDVDVYLCPSDKGRKPKRVKDPDALPYPLSYAMNNIADYRTASTWQPPPAKLDSWSMRIETPLTTVISIGTAGRITGKA